VVAAAQIGWHVTLQNHLILADCWDAADGLHLHHQTRVLSARQLPSVQPGIQSKTGGNLRDPSCTWCDDNKIDE
jgi:hypothetical protein